MPANLKPDVEQDAYWHQEMGRLPELDDDSFAVHEVRLGRRSPVREILETIGLTLLIFLLVRAVVQNFVVDGSSMEPSLYQGQYLLVNKAAYVQWDTNFLPRLNPFQDSPAPPVNNTYLLGGPQRGDIVVFLAPHDTRDFIKRVIGLPKETVEVRANQGVFINGQKLVEPYIKEVPNYDWPAPNASSQIPDGMIFVLGDNRRYSDDSHIFGPIAIDTVAGRAWFQYWPLDHAGPIAHPTYHTP